MNNLDISRNDVLAINGKRYEVLNYTGPVYGPSHGERVVELNRIGEPAGNPRFLLVLQEVDGEEPVQFWERDARSGELIDVPVQQLEVLGI